MTKTKEIQISIDNQMPNDLTTKEWNEFVENYSQHYVDLVVERVIDDLEKYKETGEI